MERCLREITEIEAALLAGNLHIEGLCLAPRSYGQEGDTQSFATSTRARAREKEREAS